MQIQKCVKESFSVIGKEGSTEQGEGFVEALWNDANSHFSEIEALAKRGEHGAIGGTWGLMTDFSRTWKPWEDGYSKGLYLAGVEVVDDAQPPRHWVKWTIPGFAYIYIGVDRDYREAFSCGLRYIEENGLALAGAVQEFNCLEEQKLYLFFPISKL